jgi:hypothetical protein
MPRSGSRRKPTDRGFGSQAARWLSKRASRAAAPSAAARAPVRLVERPARPSAAAWARPRAGAASASAAPAAAEDLGDWYISPFEVAELGGHVYDLLLGKLEERYGSFAASRVASQVDLLFDGLVAVGRARELQAEQDAAQEEARCEGEGEGEGEDEGVFKEIAEEIDSGGDEEGHRFTGPWERLGRSRSASRERGPKRARRGSRSGRPRKRQRGRR